jgi:hypothetical protein
MKTTHLPTSVKTEIDTELENCKLFKGLELKAKEERLLELFNRLLDIVNLEYEKFNIKVTAGNKSDDLVALEKEFNELGVASWGEHHGVWISTLSLFATITAIFTDGKRLAFLVNDEGRMTGVRWYEGDK